MNDTVMLVDLSRRSGGAQRRIIEQCRRWSGPGDLVVVHLAGTELEAALDDSPTCRRRALRRARWNPWLVVDLLRLMRQEQATVVDAHNVVAQVWSVIAARLARVPRIFCTVHSDYRSEHEGSSRALLYSGVIRVAGAVGSRFIAVESRVGGFIETCGVSARHIVTIPNAAVQPVATPGARPTIRGELGLTNEFVVVFAGRLEPVKRIESLVRAFAEDEVALSHAHLVVAGDGSQRPVLEELVADLGLAERVRFLGHRHDVVDVIAAADCVALVSSSEGLPYVVLEAIALDRPLILSRLPALVDLLGDEGAEFVGVGDHQGTARSIMRLAGDDRLCARLARTASSRVAERLPPAQMSIATEAAYYGPHRPVDLVRMIRPDGVGFNRTFNVVRRIAPFIDRPTRVLSVLTYHRVATDEHDRCLDPVLKSATPEMFEQQMALLRRRYEPVTLADVRAALVDGHDLPAGAVLVTFDDAYRDLADHAAPILRRHGIKATVFVPTAYPGSDALDFWWDRLYRSILCSTRSALTTPIGTFVLDGSPTRASWVSNSIARHLKTLDHLAAISVVDQVVADAGQTDPWNAVMDWNQLELFLGDGHFVQSHTRTHPALDQLPIGEVETELTGSYADIVGRLGVAPIALAYPTGQSSPAVRRMIVDAGFELAFTTAPGSNRLPVEDLLSIHRIDVTASVQASHLALMLGPVASAARRLR